MGGGSSRNLDTSSHGSGEEKDDHGGGQLYVSLKMENYKIKGDVVPHVYGSVPLVGSWDTSKAVIFIIFLDICMWLLLASMQFIFLIFCFLKMVSI